jgi:hypothetical protein
VRSLTSDRETVADRGPATLPDLCGSRWAGPPEDLLRYLSDAELRRTIQAATNKSLAILINKLDTNQIKDLLSGW